MFRVLNNEISMTRGDTIVLNLTVRNYELQEGDDVVLTVKKSIHTDEIILQKHLDFANSQFIIRPQDTANLPYGPYKYDIQITTDNGNVYTIVTPHTFMIEGEVSW